MGLEAPQIVEMVARPQQDESRADLGLVGASDGVAHTREQPPITFRILGLGYPLAGRGSFDGKGDEQRGSLSRRAHDLDRSAERLDSVGEADEAGSSRGIGSSGTVVADRKLKDAVGRFDVDVRDGCVGVLGGVREGFRDYVVRSHLHLSRQAPLGMHVQLDRNGGTGGQVS